MSSLQTLLNITWQDNPTKHRQETYQKN